MTQKKSMPPEIVSTFSRLGEHIRIARKRRSVIMDEMASRMYVTRKTLHAWTGQGGCFSGAATSAQTCANRISDHAGKSRFSFICRDCKKNGKTWDLNFYRETFFFACGKSVSHLSRAFVSPPTNLWIIKVDNPVSERLKEIFLSFFEQKADFEWNKSE